MVWENTYEAGGLKLSRCFLETKHASHCPTANNRARYMYNIIIIEKLVC